MATVSDAFVARAEATLVEALILSELAQQDNLMVEALAERVRSAGPFSERVDMAYVTQTVARLEGSGHVEACDGRYRLTDAGFRDLRRAGALLSRATAALVGAGGPRAAARRV